MSESPVRDPSLAGDLWGGLAAMLVALPSAIAFGVLVTTTIGPEYAGHGAMMGMLGAAALGVTAPWIGRTGGLVTAPCAPAAAVLAAMLVELVAHPGLDGTRILALLALTALVAAFIQLMLGMLKAGRLIKFIPYQVVSGYLSGVGVIIGLGQLPKLLGLPSDMSLWRGLFEPGVWRGPSLLSGVAAIVVTVLAPRFTKRVPAAILGLAAGVLSYLLYALALPELRQVTGNPLVIGPIEASGSLLATITGRLSSITAITPADILLILVPAMTLAVLLSIDTLKTAVVLDALTRSRHDSNRELVGQGLGNLTSFLIGGMPGAGTMGPTLVNVTSGGRTPRSGFAEGLFVVVAVGLLGQLIAWVPIGALAGILLVVAWRMIDRSTLRLLLAPSTRLDFMVIASVVAVAAMVGLIQAAAVGVGLAMLLFIRDLMRGSVLLDRRDLRQVSSKTRRLAEERELLDAHGQEAALVRLQGNLFFGTTDQLLTELEPDLASKRYLLFDMRRVQSMDYTAAHLLQRISGRLRERGGQLLFCGMPSRLPTQRDLQRYLAQLGVVSEGSDSRIFETQDSALHWMETHVLEAHGWKCETSQPPLELADISLFREFEPDMMEGLAAIAEPLSVEAGAKIFSRGDAGDELFIVRRGSVRILLPLDGGKRHHLATIGRGDYFGEMSFLDDAGRSADVEAVEATDLFRISRERFNELAWQNAVIGIKVYARLALTVAVRLRTANAELRALQDR